MFPGRLLDPEGLTTKGDYYQTRENSKHQTTFPEKFLFSTQ